MDDLVQWLRVQLDEEQAEAEKLADVDDYPLDPWAIQWEETGEWNSYAYLRIAKARVLREIDAKRGIVARYEFACKEAAALDIGEEERETRVQVAAAFQSCALLLASVYADRPGFREEWRP